MEFSAVLVSQLESQRQYFESQLETLTNESAARISAIEKDLETTKASLTEVETKLAAVTKEKNLISHKLEKVNWFFCNHFAEHIFTTTSPSGVVRGEGVDCGSFSKSSSVGGARCASRSRVSAHPRGDARSPS